MIYNHAGEVTECTCKGSGQEVWTCTKPTDAVPVPVPVPVSEPRNCDDDGIETNDQCNDHCQTLHAGYSIQGRTFDDISQCICKSNQKTIYKCNRQPTGNVSPPQQRNIENCDTDGITSGKTCETHCKTKSPADYHAKVMGIITSNGTIGRCICSYGTGEKATYYECHSAPNQLTSNSYLRSG